MKVKLHELPKKWRNEAAELGDSKQYGIEQCADQLEAALVDLYDSLRYWQGISECDCHSLLPQGGCLKCDLDKILQTPKSHE